MAANLKNPGGFLISSAKKFVHQIWSNNPSSPSTTIFWRRSYVAGSVYDKNVDDQVRPTVEPEGVVEASADKYWGPNPRTGVFGPASQEGGNEGIKLQQGNGGGESAESVLGQKARFRSLEDIEKPQAN
ncbi:hypothetical protein C5167_015598 [Papaver somniferum]|uniref:Late embryogenesis abundant protein n=1 Tax=Papaver somniferum TaxID=3469 RepID=A0A4Y7JAD3_PAPSO|nr:late embryogenesis abundant protein At5g17165-like [Papaver somniferum]RZC56748.1 hypothetical protein C5167_015598 [Papaver somniferum]